MSGKSNCLVRDTHFKIVNAGELWQRENSLSSIPTFSQSLDRVLGNNGLSTNTFMELLGLPGSGKTQLCLQFCASVQIPETLGGLNAEALYIDTNTNFTICRFKEILFASLDRCRKLLSMPLDFRENDALKKLHYVNAFGLTKFCAFLHRLPRFIVQHPRIKLIVIDSIAFPFKDGMDTRQRTGLLFRLMAELQQIAVEKQIAVVLTNEMSTRLGLSSGSVVGSLGDAWAHRSNKRLLLCHTNGQRTALSLKDNSAVNAVGTFQITLEGIRDIN
ncbi:DNA repair protein RAD51 homolog 3 [Hyposmocoma kahamanoa]|uniref:DNA repair protein RAD51 homolog 3 n=1 Tax=Hyposmocoma kahamanoa TaxID=1477025 RepID=UPI000E6D70AB|nr:DNA repair protein RAD51 homolog 3 [Hyposmocoma kahamanoa]